MLGLCCVCACDQTVDGAQTPTRVQAKRGKKNEVAAGATNTEEPTKSSGGKRKKKEEGQGEGEGEGESSKDELKKDAVGRKVQKLFDGTLYSGVVKRYWPKDGLYAVRGTR